MFSRWSRPRPGLESETLFLPLRFFWAQHLTSLVTGFSTLVHLCTYLLRIPASLWVCAGRGGWGGRRRPLQPLPAFRVSHFGCGCLLGSLCPRLFPVPHLSGWRS